MDRAGRSSNTANCCYFLDGSTIKTVSPYRFFAQPSAQLVAGIGGADCQKLRPCTTILAVSSPTFENEGCQARIPLVRSSSKILTSQLFSESNGLASKGCIFCRSGHTGTRITRKWTVLEKQGNKTRNRAGGQFIETSFVLAETIDRINTSGLPPHWLENGKLR